ncbi:MAG: WG repeat-containing protein [Clostridia bacterium]|nr:WG repeat-containing protein [Clostridia bacterium]
MKKVFPLVLVIAMVLSCYMLISGRIESKKEYESYLEQARTLASQGVVVRSAEAYDNALLIKDDFEIAYEKAEMYYNNDYVSAAISYGEELITLYPKTAKAYEFLLKVYYDLQEYEDFFEVMKTVNKRKLQSEEIDKMYTEIQYVYETGFSDYVEVYNCSGNFWVACKEDKMYGYLDAYGRNDIGFKYAQAKPFALNSAGVQEPNGDWYYIDVNGDKTNAPVLDTAIQDIGILDSKVAIKTNNKYGYYSDSYKYLFGSYDYAGAFNNGVAPVKEGNTWAIINEKGEKVSSSAISDIPVDDKGVAFRNDRGFVAIDGKYNLIDSKCNKICEQTFDSAKAFLSADPAAVKVGSKWGFVNTAGETVVEPTYEDAHSFVNGLAAVCKDGKWGFIDKTNKVCIDFQFDDVCDFNNYGVTFVKVDDVWTSLSVFSKM